MTGMHNDFEDINEPGDLNDEALTFHPPDYWAHSDETGWTWMGPDLRLTNPDCFVDELYPFSEPEVAGFRSYPLESADSCVGYTAGFCWAQPESSGALPGFTDYCDLPF